MTCAFCQEQADHEPCCSSHEKPLCCAHYRRTHFVEVRPCCSIDARKLEAEVTQ